MSFRSPIVSLLCCLIAGVFVGESLRAQEGDDRRFDGSVAAWQEALGLAGGAALRVKAAWRDVLGQTHVRLDQYHQGLPVLGGEVIFHDVDRRAIPDAGTVTDALCRDIALHPQPSLCFEEAVAVAVEKAGPFCRLVRTPSVRLAILPLRTKVVRCGRAHVPQAAWNALDLEGRVLGYRLVYHVQWAVDGPHGLARPCCVVDAHSGEVLAFDDQLKTASAKGKGLSQYHGEVVLDTEKQSNTYRMRDTTRGTGDGNVTYDLANQDVTLSIKGSVFQSADNSWGDGKNYTGSHSTSPNGQTAAVDVHYGLAVAWDFYKNVLNRTGVDGKGTAVYNRVHGSKKWVNAYWSADDGYYITYGDGDLKEGATTVTALDLVAHEFTHGVCEATCNLAYKDEPGALCEANSDIGGAMAECYAKGGGFAAHSQTVPDTGADFTIAEQVGSQYTRYMYKPSKDGKSPDAWRKNLGDLDLHASAGPANRMFYFLSQGAQTSGESSAPQYLPQGMTGIGNDKATRIWFRALFTYFTSQTDYAGARTACIRAAEDLHGVDSAEVAAVRNAFAGINVGTP